MLLEAGLHNPVAVASGHQGQSEWELTLSLPARLPKQSLLPADRLYGCAAFAGQALPACQRAGSHFLIRARQHIQVQWARRLKDGSRLVRVRVGRKVFRSLELCLWTTLLKPETAPALELMELYTKRWKHQLFYRELKHSLRTSEVLQSHTMETAQETPKKSPRRCWHRSEIARQPERRQCCESALLSCSN